MIVGGRFLAHEKDFGAWGVLADEAGGLEPIEGRKADIEEDEAGVQCGGLVNGFLAVGRLGDDVQAGLSLQQGADELAKGFEVFDQENADRGVFHESGPTYSNYLYGVIYTMYTELRFSRLRRCGEEMTFGGRARSWFLLRWI